MTTTVTVKTHTHAARVCSFPLRDYTPVPDGKWQDLGRVEPNSERSFVVHAWHDLCVQELPMPAGAADA